MLDYQCTLLHKQFNYVITLKAHEPLFSVSEFGHPSYSDNKLYTLLTTPICFDKMKTFDNLQYLIIFFESIQSFFSYAYQ